MIAEIPVSLPVPLVMFLAAGLPLIIFMLAGVCLAMYQTYEEEEKKRLEEIAVKEEAQRIELETRKQKLTRQSEEETQRAINELRRAAEERYRADLPATNLDDLDRRLREAQLWSHHRGRFVTARVFISPTGWFAIEWIQDFGRAEPLKIICKRDDVVVFAERQFRGTFGGILEPSQEYIIRFLAFQHSTNCEEDLQFTVQIPSPRQWQRKVSETPVDANAQLVQRINEKIRDITVLDELWEKAKREGHAKIDASSGSDNEKRKRKAALDYKLHEEWEKEQVKQEKREAR